MRGGNQAVHQHDVDMLLQLKKNIYLLLWSESIHTYTYNEPLKSTQEKKFPKMEFKKRYKLLKYWFIIYFQGDIFI